MRESVCVRKRAMSEDIHLERMRMGVRVIVEKSKSYR